MASGTMSLGEERAAEFLDGLRQRGYDDMALAYLEQMRTSPDCPAELKESIDFEIGATHLAASRTVTSSEAREHQLDLAREAFGKFLAEHSGHKLASAAAREFGNAWRQSGRAKTESAEKPSKSEEEKAALTLAARQQYEKAKIALADAEKRFTDTARALQDVTIDPDDTASITAREQSQKDFMQVKLMVAEVEYEIGMTYDPTSAEFKTAMGGAIEKFDWLYVNHDNIGGLFARMRQGAIYSKLGEYDKAVDILKEMLTLKDQPPALRLLKTQSLILLGETYLLPDQKKHAEVVALVHEWQAAVADHEKSSSDGLKLILLGGRASLEVAKSLPPADANRKTALTDAKTQLQFVSRFHGESGREADSLLADEIFGARVEPEGLPADYAGAKERGDFAWDKMVLMLGRLQQAKDAAEQAELTETMNVARDEAILYFRLAESLRVSKTPAEVEELNLLRFRMTYLYWSAQDYHRAAVLGEFLARRYPQSVGARKGAEIAVKAYRTLFSEALKRSEDTSFATGRMTSLAEFVTARWKGEPEADEAWMMLIDTAIDNQDYAAASGYLEQMAPESPRRAAAELRVGQSLWAGYARAAATAENRPSQQELDQLAQQARHTLEQGVQRMQKVVEDGGSVDYTLVFSVLALSRILVDMGEPVEAVRLLEDPKIGPVTLSLAEHPATAPGSFRVDALRSALMAYVGAKQLGKAEETMNNLEQMVAADGDAEAGKKLTIIYIQLGKKLEERLTRLRKGNQDDQQQAQAVAEAFEEFLSRIAEREQGNTYGSLNWVAETFVSLGASMDPGVGKAPPEAIEYYRQAEATYLRMLDDLSADEKPPGADESLNIRRAACLRAMGQCKNAMILLVGLLKDHERRIDLQIEAAKTYQAWGRDIPGYYLKAIVGGQKKADGRNLVWGWSGLANKIYSHEKYREQFHEARYNAAVCRKEYALTLKDKTKRNDSLKKAETDIRRIYQLYPVMGGPDQFAQYDALLKSIQKLRGERSPQGLRDSE